MDNSTRLEYLQAMGIKSWVLRESPETHRQPVINLAEKVDATVIERQVKETLSDLNLPIETAIPEMVSTPSPSTMPLETTIKPDNWQDLEREVSQCQKCELSQTRTQTVFGTGNHQADWMLIGEAPGETEDLHGKPFVGEAGFLLTEMLRSLGLQREQVFIANILKCHPPNNRDPKVKEISTCQAYLQRQIALVQPKIILAVGRIAAQNLLNTHDSLAKLRGKVYTLENIPLVVVYHPAYLLRFLNQKRKAWQDLQLALSTYNNTKI